MSQSYLGSILLKITNIKHIKQFHAQLIQYALHHHSYWASHVIALCTRFHAPLPYTTRIFYSVHHPNALVFTNMIRYYSKLDTNNEILTLFEQMKHRGLKPDACVYPILIKATGRNVVLIRSELVKRGLDSGKYIRNGLMNVYGKYGNVEAARKVFDEMSDKSAADWNGMISAYWNWGIKDEAKYLFDLMTCKNVITWTSMVTGYSKMKDIENARRYFDQMPEKTVVSWNAMLSGYAQNGFCKEALSLFHKMVSSNVTPNETSWVVVISSCSSTGDPELTDSVMKMLYERGIQLNPFIMTALLDLHAKCGRIEAARKIFDELGPYKNLVTWNSMVSAYTRNSDLISARELFDQIPKKDIVSWNSMIAGYTQSGQSALAIELFKEMIENGMMPDEVTMVSVISACGHLGALELGNWVASFINMKHMKLSISGYNSLVFMYSRCGNMNLARTTFQEMNVRDVVTYNALITGYANHGNGNEALKLLKEMKDEEIEPDRITYIVVLTACSHSGMLEEGKNVFSTIKLPDLDHYACIIDLMGRVGKLDEAVKIVEKMPISPHAGIYGSLLNASRLHKRIDIGEFAAKKLFELEPENSGNYVLLSNMYASEGKWKDVGKTRELMKTRGVIKTTGWSWVEHDSSVHKFTVGDRTHDRSSEIYAKLAELIRRICEAGYVPDKSNVLRDIEEEEKEQLVEVHSEKLAVAFAILVSEQGSVIRVVKNLRICWDCHTAIKLISKLEGREIIVRDNNRFHCFKDNACSCNEFW